MTQGEQGEEVQEDQTQHQNDQEARKRNLPRLPEMSENPLQLEGLDGYSDLPGLARKPAVTAGKWQLCSYQELPDWLKDNSFLLNMHRPELSSFIECIKSIFMIHTETGNIWTHLLGAVLFMGIALRCLFLSTIHLPVAEQVVFQIFFVCAVLCLGFSTTYHTVHCHSPFISNICHRLDYCGIAIMVTGSFVPSLYYQFYCEKWLKIGYIFAVVVMGAACVAVSMLDKFATPAYRRLRTGLYITFGLSGVIPAIQYLSMHGWVKSTTEGSVQWLALMAFLYIFGALLYANRIPERYFPGKCDIMFQSHQIFHVLVVCAAFVHYHGINKMAKHRMTVGDCPVL